MARTWKLAVWGMCAAAVLPFIGCDSGGGSDRLNNQGGASIFSVGAKLAGDNIGGLNPDEWQYLTDNADTLAVQFGIDLGQFGDLPELTDEQAQALVDWLAANGVQTQADLRRLFSDAAAGEVEIPEELIDVVEGMMG